MFELVFVPLALLYLLAIAFLVSQIRPPHPGGERLAPHSSTTPAGPLRLWIEGTERPMVRDVAPVRAAGLDLRTLHDLRVYEHDGALDGFPTHLIALLFHLYRNGAVRGCDAMALLFHGRALAADEAVYFALVDVPPEPSVVAFIGRRPGRRGSAAS